MTRLRVLAAAVLLAVPLLVTAPATAAAKRYPLDPAKNIPVPGYVFAGACGSAPTSQDCTRLFVRALNDARATMSQPDYHLPVRFITLTGPERLLVLANQDRVLYGRTPLTALNSTLNSSAHQGALHDRDPFFVKVNGKQFQAAGSNWAGSTRPMNPLYAYYLWMYDDGPGSDNIDCQKAGDPGCWGHRENTLAGMGAGNKVLVGASSGKGVYYAWTQLFESFRQSDYTPLIPTVQGLNTHRAPAGSILHITGFGLYHAGPVTVVGHQATILERHNTSLDVRVPSGSGSGYVVVTGNGGTSSKTYAAAFAYG